MALTAASLTLAGTITARRRTTIGPIGDPDLRSGVKIGYLDCTIGGGIRYVLGSAKEIECDFRSSLSGERSDHYSGAIKKLGVDVGFTTRSRLIWAVFAPTAGYHHGWLGGIYAAPRRKQQVGPVWRQRAVWRHGGLDPSSGHQCDGPDWS